MARNCWTRFPCTKSELRLDTTLVCGQSFRWHEVTSGTWTGVLSDRVWSLFQTDTEICFDVKPCEYDIEKVLTKVHQNKKKTHFTNSAKEVVPDLENEKLMRDEKNISFLKSYFQLNVNLERLYEQWSEADPVFEKCAPEFQGVRILRQDPVENLFSFICSSNNNISRISSMVEKLCVHYGKKVGHLNDIDYYSFPCVKSLAQDGVEERLRSLGFGYRAKYISQTAKFINEEKSDDWLYKLREEPYDKAKSELIQLCGVGPKVADCICLMSLDKIGAIPVDTHVWQIASRDYLPKLTRSKSLTDKLYKEIGDHFRSLWGDYAGWAHSVLFAADLKQFKGRKLKSLDKQPTKKSKAVKRKLQE